MGSLGQSSLEYMVTYGWMVAAAGVAATALYPTVSTSCNVRAQESFRGDIILEQIGVDTRGDFKIRVDSESDRKLLIDSLRLEGPNKSIEIIQPKSIEPGAEVSYDIGQVRQTEECKTFDLKLQFDKGPLKNQQKSIRIKGSLELIESIIQYLRAAGDSISVIEIEGNITPTYKTMCFGVNCDSTQYPDNLTGSEEYINVSGDEMLGTLRTDHLLVDQSDPDCIGVKCDFSMTNDKGYVTPDNNTIQGGLNITEVKPIDVMCIGKRSVCNP